MDILNVKDCMDLTQIMMNKTVVWMILQSIRINFVTKFLKIIPIGEFCMLQILCIRAFLWVSFITEIDRTVRQIKSILQIMFV